MATTVSSRQKTVEEWEAFLKPQVNNVELLGEIPITQKESALLGQAIARLTKLLGHRRSLRWLLERAKSAFAVYLVAEGIHSYNGGDYWTKVLEASGWSSGYTSQIGQTFEESLEALHLPLFYEMRAEKAHRYVSLILAHGGIPTYCLSDFFENMLQPAVLHAEFASMTPGELIDEWRWRAKAQLFTDKPVLRFLTYGGRVAEDFLDRCREMAMSYVETGTILPAEDLGLPARVVEAYAEWVATQDDVHAKREDTDRWRLRKPVVLVDPWGEGVYVDLPPQQVPATFIEDRIAWRVSFGGKTAEAPVRVRRAGFDWTTVSASVRLGSPADIYEVTFAGKGSVLRTWRFQGVSEATPTLVFDADRGTALAWGYALQAGQLGFFYPRDCELVVKPAKATPSGAAAVRDAAPGLREQLPRMPGAWSGYEGQVWELNLGDQVALRRDGKDILTAVVRANEEVQRPRLVGGQLVYEDPTGLRAPVYAGAPPQVRIPLTGRGTLDEELARWRLTIKSKWAAAPELDVTHTLEDLQNSLIVSEGHVDLRLSAARLLGTHPVGNYAVRLRGPLGRSAEFTVRILGHLTVCGQEALYLPEPKTGHQPVTLLVETVAGDRLDCRGYAGADQESTECRTYHLEQGDGKWQYELNVPTNVTEVEMTVIHPLPKGDPVRVPVHVPVRRLRWAWSDSRGERVQREWTGRTIRQPIEALLQTDAPALLVNLPQQDTEDIRLALRVTDTDGTTLIAQRVPRPPRQHHLWRADLSAFLDTIRASTLPTLSFELGVWGLFESPAVHKWYVLTVTRSLNISGIRTRASIQDDTLHVVVYWVETTQLRNRRLRLWSLWRPWQPVQEYDIPDTAQGEFRFSAASADMPPGAYRVRFLTVDPWTPDEAPVMPREGERDTADVTLIVPHERLSWLESAMTTATDPFALWLESAYLAQSLGDTARSLEYQRLCYGKLDTAPVPEILALHGLVTAMNDARSRHAIELRMFAARRIERLLDDHSKGAISGQHFEAYMACMPTYERLPLETCSLLLLVDDERIRVSALRQIMKRGSILGPRIVCEWVREARMSDADAIAILGENLQLAVDSLLENTDDSTARRLLGKVDREVGNALHIVVAGFWVRTEAGWGRIEGIEDSEGQPVNEYIVGEMSYKLSVTLRPDTNPEAIVVDLAAKRIIFQSPLTLYTCTRCGTFTSTSRDLVREGHNRASHGGIEPSFRPEKFNWRSLRTLEYSARRPGNDLA